MYANRLQSSILLSAILLLTAVTALAAGSPPKPAQKDADESAMRAAVAYNDGVKKMTRADAVGVQKSATFTYDYAAAPDGKALREYEGAIADFTRALSYDAKMKEAHNNLGYCLRRVGRLPESLAAYDKAIELDPDFAQAREYRGETYLALSQPDKAEAELAALRELKSKYAEQLQLAITMYRDRERQAAGTPGK